MSYCRNNGEDSDVYLIASADGFECFGVSDGKFHTEIHLMHERTEVMRHLVTHRNVGEKVPDRAFQRLLQEYLEHGEWDWPDED